MVIHIYTELSPLVHTGSQQYNGPPVAGGGGGVGSKEPSFENLINTIKVDVLFKL